MESRSRHGNIWLVLVIVGLAQFMVILDATIVNVALPSIQRGLGFSTGTLQWVVNSYTLTFGGFLMLGGRAGDLFGRKRLFILGIVVFSAASLLNGLAGSAGVLVALHLAGEFAPFVRADGSGHRIRRACALAVRRAATRWSRS